MADYHFSVIDEKARLLQDVADYLWDNPETAFSEFKAAEKICSVLRDEGFEVRENLAGIATAFSGTYGCGRPIIGILGEYDSLSGLSQVAGITRQESAGGECGHGCGHNLLGAGALGAAIAVKEWLKESGHAGTVIYFGTPGEEGGSGKGFMARDGVFDELDGAITWHPDTKNSVLTGSLLANCQVLYRFDGVSSHAGSKPHLGRSALDAVELMNVGVQFLREHIPTSCRIHYAITDTGGFSPNVVQSHAEVLYLMRGLDNQIVGELYERVNDIAKGAALMTSTQESHEFIKACSSYIPNPPMQKMLYEKMREISIPAPNQEDIDFARRLTADALSAYTNTDMENPLSCELEPYDEGESQHFGSSDVGDVSWVCPTAWIWVNTQAKGTPGHSWQLVTQGKTPYAHRMTRYAAKIMAAGVIELITNPALLEEAKEEHRRRVGAEGYIPPIPKGVRPRSLKELQK